MIGKDSISQALISKGIRVDKVPAILMISGAPYVFPKGWMKSEQLTFGASPEYPTNKNDPMIILPTERSITLKIEIPLGLAEHKVYYNVAKQAIRAAEVLFTTTKMYRKSEEVKGSKSIPIFDSISYKYPLKKQSEGFLGVPQVEVPKVVSTEVSTGVSEEIGIKKTIENLKGKAGDNKKLAKIIKKMEKIEKKLGGSVTNPKKFEFRDIALPWWVPLSCGYFGESVQSFGCILTSFTTSYDSNVDVESWDITLVEYEFKNHQEEDQTPTEEGEEEEGEEEDEKYEVDPTKSVLSEGEEIKPLDKRPGLEDWNPKDALEDGAGGGLLGTGKDAKGVPLDYGDKIDMNSCFNITTLTVEVAKSIGDEALDDWIECMGQ